MPSRNLAMLFLGIVLLKFTNHLYCYIWIIEIRSMNKLKLYIFCQKSESKQYNDALALTKTIGETSQRKLYEELALKSFKSRRWMRRLFTSFKIKTAGLKKFFFTLFLKKTIFVIHSPLHRHQHAIEGLIY